MPEVQRDVMRRGAICGGYLQPNSRMHRATSILGTAAAF